MTTFVITISDKEDQVSVHCVAEGEVDETSPAYLLTALTVEALEGLTDTQQELNLEEAMEEATSVTVH